ncbi:hypothetical protein [Bacillus massiliglaciei]|uniref:hypothetical protein n=1 Tax=Bacillus massiliglaciei TaxID=1816693 RepID=UPI000DA5F4E7|nr:hypothetical protein [Bacillus massiliglaciei]
MGKNSEDTQEIQAMIDEISASLDRLEKEYLHTVNFKRCKMWAEQYSLIHAAQEAIDQAESSLNWVIGGSHPLSEKPNRKELSIKAEPKLGY